MMRPAGASLLDGIDVCEYTVRSLRQSVAMVFQDTVLFRGTVRDNIAYGRPGATFDEIVRAATIADAHEFIAQMPAGYETLIGDRGLTLSGGQRQRIGIARAVIRNSPILILDEPTAALDSETEEEVIDALERAMEHRTAILISHRLSTLRGASRILVLKGGRIVEQGSHDELVALRGVYAELVQSQVERERVGVGV